jgi:hypothetical protein
LTSLNSSVAGVAQTIVVGRLRTVLELGRPRKTMACPTADLLDAARWPQILSPILLVAASDPWLPQPS